MAVWLARLLAGLASAVWMATAIAGGDLPVITLSLGGQKITVEIAATTETLERGLQGRASLPENAGMLFVLPAEALRCVWMKDTPLPLSAAFLDEAGAVIMLADMEPLSLDFHCSASSARYILEMNRGWFARHGVAVGTHVDLESLHTNRGCWHFRTKNNGRGVHPWAFIEFPNK